MAGLLSGIGQVLAGGVAGGAKAAGESFVEQAKQEALAAREENMLRIQNLFAKEGRAETQTFQAGESKLGRESAKSLAESSQVNASILQGERLTSAENLAEVERLSRSEEAAAAATAAQKLLTFKNDLPDKEKSTVEKAVLGLERLGMPRAQALAVALSSVTKEESAEERALLRTWQTVFTENKKSGETAEEAARQATTLTGVDPVELVSQMRARRSGAGPATTKTAAPAETLVERAKKLKAEKEKKAAGKNTGLLVGEPAWPERKAGTARPTLLGPTLD